MIRCSRRSKNRRSDITSEKKMQKGDKASNDNKAYNFIEMSDEEKKDDSKKQNEEVNFLD